MDGTTDSKLKPQEGNAQAPGEMTELPAPRRSPSPARVAQDVPLALPEKPEPASEVSSSLRNTQRLLEASLSVQLRLTDSAMFLIKSDRKYDHLAQQLGNLIDVILERQFVYGITSYVFTRENTKDAFKHEIATFNSMEVYAASRENRSRLCFRSNFSDLSCCITVDVVDEKFRENFGDSIEMFARLMILPFKATIQRHDQLGSLRGSEASSSVDARKVFSRLNLVSKTKQTEEEKEAAAEREAAELHQRMEEAKRAGDELVEQDRAASAKAKKKRANRNKRRRGKLSEASSAPGDAAAETTSRIGVESSTGKRPGPPSPSHQRSPSRPPPSHERPATPSSSLAAFETAPSSPVKIVTQQDTTGAFENEPRAFSENTPPRGRSRRPSSPPSPKSPPSPSPLRDVTLSPAINIPEMADFPPSNVLPGAETVTSPTGKQPEFKGMMKSSTKDTKTLVAVPLTPLRPGIPPPAPKSSESKKAGASPANTPSPAQTRAESVSFWDDRKHSRSPSFRSPASEEGGERSQPRKEVDTGVEDLDTSSLNPRASEFRPEDAAAEGEDWQVVQSKQKRKTAIEQQSGNQRDAGQGRGPARPRRGQPRPLAQPGEIPTVARVARTVPLRGTMGALPAPPKVGAESEFPSLPSPPLPSPSAPQAPKAEVKTRSPKLTRPEVKGASPTEEAKSSTKDIHHGVGLKSTSQQRLGASSKLEDIPEESMVEVPESKTGLKAPVSSQDKGKSRELSEAEPTVVSSEQPPATDLGRSDRQLLIQGFKKFSLDLQQRAIKKMEMPNKGNRSPTKGIESQMGENESATPTGLMPLLFVPAPSGRSHSVPAASYEQTFTPQAPQFTPQAAQYTPSAIPFTPQVPPYAPTHGHIPQMTELRQYSVPAGAPMTLPAQLEGGVWMPPRVVPSWLGAPMIVDYTGPGPIAASMNVHGTAIAGPVLDGVSVLGPEAAERVLAYTGPTGFVPRDPNEPLPSKVPGKPAHFVYRMDSTGWECAKEGCEKRTNDWDGYSEICMRCGPYSPIRYCSTKHMVDDAGTHHYSVCPVEPFRAPAVELPRRFEQGTPSIININGKQLPEHSRQVAFNASSDVGGYALFDDYIVWKNIGMPGDAADYRARGASGTVWRMVTFEGEPEKMDRFNRVLHCCLYDEQANQAAIIYLGRMIRENLRQNGHWNEDAMNTLQYQFMAEFKFAFLNNIFAQSNRDNCFTEWLGISARYCSEFACRAELCNVALAFGDMTYGRGIKKYAETMEAYYWELRAWRVFHPEVTDVKERVKGVGFRGVPSDQQGKLRGRGEGWDGYGNVGDERCLYKRRI